MVNRIEAIVDAIGRLNALHNPESCSYRLRSPLLVKSFAKPGKHDVDEEGRRIFASLLSGYKAAVFDVQKKLEGKSRAGLKATDRLENLLGVYNIKDKLPVDHIVSFLRRALADQNISSKTELSYFSGGPAQNIL